MLYEQPHVHHVRGCYNVHTLLHSLLIGCFFVLRASQVLSSSIRLLQFCFAMLYYNLHI